MSDEQYRAFRVPWFSPTGEDLEQVLLSVQKYWKPAMDWSHSTIPHPVCEKFRNSDKTDVEYEACAKGIAGFMMPLVTPALIAVYRYSDPLDFLGRFKTMYEEVLLSELLKGRAAEGSWLVVRLVRTADMMARSVRR